MDIFGRLAPVGPTVMGKGRKIQLALNVVKVK